MYSCETVSSFVLADRSAYGPDLMRIVEGVFVPDADRRRRDRLPLELKVYLLRSTDAHSIESRTIDVNCNGFYCRVQEPFLTGECIRCTIAVPTVGRPRGEHHVMVECEATVVRVDHHDGQYGLGCRIDNYNIVPSR